MKKIVKKLILLVIFAVCCIISRADGADNALAYPKLEYDPTPKAFSFNREGALPVKLNTGSVSYQVPIFTYEDQDFSIPFSLSYMYSGFRPGTPTGELGLGWSLSAGGSISREIIGYDDFRQGGYRSGPGYPGAEDVLSLECSLHDGDMYPMFNAGGETTPDVFHFSFMGHSGSFIKGHDGQYHAYGTGDGHGTYSISIDSHQVITIVTADGMQWVFGGDTVNGREYLINCDPMSETYNRTVTDEEKSVITWLLTDIVAPDGRRVEFVYGNTQHFTVRPQYFHDDGSHDDVVTSFTPSLHRLNEDTVLYKEASLRTTSYLRKVKVYGTGNLSHHNVIAQFQWSDKNGSELDQSLDQSATHYYAPLVVPTLKLDSVVIKDNGRTLRTASMTYYTQGTRTMLQKISLGGIGDYEFQYQEGWLPGLTSNAVDYWGYYNGKVNNSDFSVVGPTDIDINCDEWLPSSSTGMDPSWQYSRIGALTRIDYPTGGYSTIQYEANRASYILLRKSNLGTGVLEELDRVPMPDEPVLYDGVSGFVTGRYPVLSMLHSNECGGIRVKSITDCSLSSADQVRSFQYVMENGESSGTVNQFGRYFARKIGNTKTYNKFLKYPGTSFGENLITYSRVKETLSDGSSTVTEYSSWSEYPDTFIPLKRRRTYAADRDNYQYGVFLDNILREPCSKAHMRSLPLRVRRFSPAGYLLEEEQTQWVELGEQYSAYVVGSGNYWYAAKRQMCDVRPGRVTATSYYEGNGSLTSVKVIEYDGLGRTQRTTDTDWEGDSRITDIEYAQNTGRLDLPSVVSTSILKQGAGSAFRTGSKSYTYVRNGAFYVLGSVSDMLYDAGGSGEVSNTAVYSGFDAYGNPRQSVVNGRKKVYLWGHRGRYLVAKIENVEFSSMPQALKGEFISNLSDTDKSRISSLQNVLATTYDYIPSVGVSRIGLPSGNSVDYEYDEYGRLVGSSDVDGDIMDVEYGWRGLARYVKVSDSRGGADLVSETVLDGLGRVRAEAVHPLGEQDSARVVLRSYDACGREDKQYLPYVESIYPAVSEARQQQYWAGLYGSSESAFACTRNAWDNALSVRREEKTLPGRVMADNFKAAVSCFRTNGTGEVPYIGYDENDKSLSVRGHYPSGALLCELGVSQDNDTSLVFKNKLGNIVMERRCPGSGYIDTYIVYDAYDRPVWVLTPPAMEQVEPLAASGGTNTIARSASIASSYCYLYDYDGKGNLAGKKIPGQDTETQEYNAAHQPTVIHPSLFTGYDISIHKTYDNFGRLGQTYVSRNLPELIPAAVSGRNASRQAAVHPLPLDDTFPLSSYKYADNGMYEDVPASLAFVPLSGVAESYSQLVRGYLVSESHCLVDSTFMTLGAGQHVVFERGEAALSYLSHGDARSVHYYDRIGDKVQSVTLWPDGSKTRMSFKYNSCRQCTDIVEVYENTQASFTGGKVWKWTRLAYNGFGELVQSTTRTGYGLPNYNNPSAWEQCTKEYDGTGRLAAVEHRCGSNRMRVDYSYTIQGFTSRISASLNNSPMMEEEFRFWDPLHAAIQPRYDGKISEIATRYQGSTSAVCRAFAYDKAGRLTGQKRFGPDGSQVNSLTEENISYDCYGNIVALTRYDADGARHDLSFSYSGALLSSKSEAGVTGAENYSYDSGGNLSSIGAVFNGKKYKYNVIGKLALVSARELSTGPYFAETETPKARMSYLGDGTLYEVCDEDGVSTLYRGSFILKRGSTGTSLEMVTFDGGFIAGVPYVFVNDHLGSVRHVVNLSTATTVEDNEYQAFGSRNTSSGTSADVNRFHFHGKESLSLSGMNYLNYPARLYNPENARWNSPDPMAEKYYYLSPYAFCNNNPVIFVDPDGEVIDTAWDAANVAMDVTSLVANAASGNIPGAVVDAASLAIDAVAAVIPGLPGGAGTVVKALRSPEKAKAALEGFKVAGEFGIGTYRKLRKAVVERFGKGSGLEVHHLIEQRLAKFLGVEAKDIPSIVLTKDEHRIFTNAWREKIPYGSGKKFTADDIYEVAYEIYEEYKEILEQIVKLKK